MWMTISSFFKEKRRKKRQEKSAPTFQIVWTRSRCGWQSRPAVCKPEECSPDKTQAMILTSTK